MIQVAIGVLLDSNQQIFIAQRSETSSFPGLWEFPGGKLEADETPEQALIRELSEEIGITVLNSKPIARFTHKNYEAGDVEIFCYQILEYQGKPYGKENQATRWVPIDKLNQYEFPAANQRIIGLIQASNCTSVLSLIPH